MGLFGTKLSDIELAEYIFSTLGLGSDIPKKHESVVKKHLRKCKSRQDVLDLVISLCEEPNTPRERYLIATAYSWSSVKYADKRIEYIKLYLDNPLYEKAYANRGGIDSRFPTQKELDEANRNYHLCEMLHYMGMAYESLYDFEKALECYQKTINLRPDVQATYCWCAEVLRKLNRIDEAIELLEKSLDSKWTKPITWKDVFGNIHQKDTHFSDVIKKELADLQIKKQKGYIYKPRPKK